MWSPTSNTNMAETLHIFQELARDQAEPVRLAALSALLKPVTVEQPLVNDGDSVHRPLDYFHELICSVPTGENASLSNAGEQIEVAGQQHPDAQQDVVVQSIPAESEPGECAAPPPVTVSTLDSIVRDNERIALKKNKSDSYDPFVQADELSEDIQEYADVVRRTVREREACLIKRKCR